MKPKIALLHIGTPKTGTTSIQDALFRAEQRGLLHPYIFPIFRNEHDHNRLTTLYLAHEEQPDPRKVQYPRDDNRYQNARRNYRRFLFETLRSSGGAILSAEVLSNMFSPQHIVRFRGDLESLGFNEFYIALYIREPADFYLSRSQERLKHPAYREKPVTDPFSFRYRFRSFAEDWEKVFPGRVIVRCHRRSASYDAISDFSNLMKGCLGIGLPPAAARRNESVSAEAMVVLQHFRETVGTDAGGFEFPGLYRLVDFLVKSNGYLPQTKPNLKASVAQLIRAIHRSDMEFIGSRYGVDLGMGRFESSEMLPTRSSWRVEDILESFDPAIVQRLKDDFRRHGPRLLLSGLAKSGFRKVYHSNLLHQAESWLKSRFR
jgi:hypothetical protein